MYVPIPKSAIFRASMPILIAPQPDVAPSRIAAEDQPRSRMRQRIPYLQQIVESFPGLDRADEEDVIVFIAVRSEELIHPIRHDLDPLSRHSKPPHGLLGHV